MDEITAPYDIETERLLLSALVVATPDIRDEVTSRITPDLFVDEWHGALAVALTEARRMDTEKLLPYLRHRMNEIDDRDQVDWGYWMWRLMCAGGEGISGNPKNIPWFLATLKRLASHRRRIEHLEEQLEEARNDAALEILQSRGCFQTADGSAA